jgi:hypothetical protein
MTTTDTIGGSRTRAVRSVEVPVQLRRLSTLGRLDYVDGHVVDVDPDEHPSGEAWARAVLEDAPFPERRTLPYAWRALGLRHGSVDAADHVLGWPVRVSSPAFALLGAESLIGMPAELLFAREPEGVLMATFMRHEGPTARALWAATEHVHRATVRRVLGHSIGSRGDGFSRRRESS